MTQHALAVPGHRPILAARGAMPDMPADPLWAVVAGIGRPIS